MTRHVLVTGGTGTVGREVVAQLAAHPDVSVTFTYLANDGVAENLVRTHNAKAVQLDLRDEEAIKAVVSSLKPAPTAFVHCAAVLNTRDLSALSMSDLNEQLAVNANATLLITQRLLESMRIAGGGDVVVMGALDRGQSLPIPVGFAASQGALSALVMAMSRELGPDNIRVNMVSSGLLEGGLSSRLSEKIIEDYKAFSAMRRLGRAEEVARAVVWLTLENSYMSGKIMPVNGGI